MNTPGIITIKLEGVTFEQTERCRKMIHKLFEKGFFNIRNGSFTANFDSKGDMVAGEHRLTWRDATVVEPNSLILEQFKIETEPVHKSTVARSGSV